MQGREQLKGDITEPLGPQFHVLQPSPPLQPVSHNTHKHTLYHSAKGSREDLTLEKIQVYIDLSQTHTAHVMKAHCQEINRQSDKLSEKTFSLSVSNTQEIVRTNTQHTGDCAHKHTTHRRLCTQTHTTQEIVHTNTQHTGDCAHKQATNRRLCTQTRNKQVIWKDF